MAKIYRNICKCCGEEFETTIASTGYCQKDACQEAKFKKWETGLPYPEKDEDLPLGLIAQIMHEECISYTRYAFNRSIYIERWKNRNK